MQSMSCSQSGMCTGYVPLPIRRRGWRFQDFRSVSTQGNSLAKPSWIICSESVGSILRRYYGETRKSICRTPVMVITSFITRQEGARNPWFPPCFFHGLPMVYSWFSQKHDQNPQISRKLVRIWEAPRARRCGSRIRRRHQRAHHGALSIALRGEPMGVSMAMVPLGTP